MLIMSIYFGLCSCVSISEGEYVCMDTVGVCVCVDLCTYLRALDGGWWEG